MARRTRSSCQALLQEVRAKCDHVPEISSMCLRAVARLEHLYDGVVALEETDPTWIKYLAALVHLDKITRRKLLLVRLATSRTIAQRVAAVQEDLDELEHGVTSKTSWRDQCESDQAEQLASLREQLGQRSIRQLVSGVSLDQVLMDLEKELKRKDLPKDEHDLKETTLGRIMAYTDRKDVQCPDWFISESELDYGEGPSEVGQFAETLRATWYHDGKRDNVIVKRLLAEIGAAARDPFITQLKMWLQLDHPNVLKLLGGCDIGAQPFYVCEDPGSGNLADFFRSKRSRVEYLKLFIQIAEGMVHLHYQGVVHGGLTVRNVLVGEAKTPKLSDFGFSDVSSLSAGMSVSSYQVRKDMHRWQPKEVLEGGAQRFESDVFMLGVCMLEAIVGEELFGSQERGDTITPMDKMFRPDNVPESVWQLVRKMCASNCHERISLKDAIEEMKHQVESPGIVVAKATKLQYHQGVHTRERAQSFIVEGLPEKPSSTQALKDLTGRCRRMPEAEQLIKHVLRRLQLLHDDVAGADDAKPRTKYCDVMTRFVNLLRRKALLLRLASSETIVLTIRGLQDKITEVAQLVGRADDPELNAWQESWDEDRAQQLVKLQKLVTGASDRMLVNEFRGDKKVQEALMALNSGISWKGQSPEMLEFKKTTFKRVSSYLNKEGLRMFDWFIPIDDVEYEAEAIGSGTFGNVCRGTWLHDGQRTEVAVKLLFPETSSESDDALLRQLQLWWDLPKSKYILKMHGGSHVSNPQFYVCENAPNGNIADFLEDESHSVLFWRLFKQVAEGIKFLHSNNTIHGGLKCNNILVGEDFTPKLADFGFSSVRTLSAGLAAGADAVSKASVRWKAKEVLEESGGTAPRYESDIYSLAMCMLEAKSHEPPFGMLDDDEAMTDIMNGAVHPRPDPKEANISDDEWAFISRLSNPDYTQRPSIDQVLKEMEVFVDAEEGAMSMDAFGMSESLREGGIEEKASTTPTPTGPQVKESSVCSSCTESSDTSTRRCRYCGFSSTMNDEKRFARTSFATYTKTSTKTEVLHRLYDMALVLQDLREQNIVHANVVPGSIRIGHDGTAHLIGFDLRNTPVESETCRWLAPECLNGSNSSFEADVYSLGMCMIYALSGEPPWGVSRSDDEIRRRVGQLHEIPSQPDKITEAEWEVVKQMCNNDPAKRMQIVTVRRELAKLVFSESSRVPEWKMAPDLISISDVVSFPNAPFVSHYWGYWTDAVVCVDKVSKVFTTMGWHFRNVADLWFSLRHPTVLQLFGAYDDDKGAYFVCEHAERGDLRTYIRSNPDTTEVWNILRDAALALHYLHCERVVHGDVGLHNIRVDGSGGGKLSGFYLSSKNHTGRSVEDEPLCEEDWSPPTCSRRHRAGYESDVYSLGRCIIEAISGDVAQGKADPISASLCSRCAMGELPPQPDAFSTEEWRLVSDMCCKGIEMPEVVHRITRLAAVNTIVNEKLASVKPPLPSNARQAAQELMLRMICELENEDDEQEDSDDEGELDLTDQISYELQAARELRVFRPNDESFVAEINKHLKRSGRAEVELISAARFENHVKPRLSSVFKWTLHHESITQFKDADQINKGSFASVWKGTWLGATVALKKLKRVDQGQSLREEVNLWFRVRHPNIVCLFGACCRSCQVFVCDLVDGGRLDEFCSVKKDDDSKEPKEFRPSDSEVVQIWGFLHDAAVGLQGLHAYGIVHADLKCDNILVTKDMRRAKLIDFGLSCLSTSDGGKAQGAFRWKAPECLKDAGPTFASDVYSFGMCILQALSGAFPWGKTSDQTVIWEVANGHLPQRPALFSDLEWDFVQRMCCFKPEDRLQVDQVVKVLGFFAQRDPYVNDQKIQGTLAQWERDPLPVQPLRQP